MGQSRGKGRGERDSKVGERERREWIGRRI